MNPDERIRRFIADLYPADGDDLWMTLKGYLEIFRRQNPQLKAREEFNEEDVILITYGDQFSETGRPPLQSLGDFLERHLKGVISGVHILPFYPYSSDDGFSVIDYKRVDPALGTWADIEELAGRFDLMMDAVINHISRESDWFTAFRKREEPFRDFFIAADPDTDLSATFRPRAHPLLTPFETADGRKYLWTTFSEDQVDLDYANPRVLFEIILVLLFYVEKGARLIRLDAIGYIWKQIGTASLNLPQAHQIVKLFRAILDFVAPGVMLVTETNVPHTENIAYFGNPLQSINAPGDLPRGDEAQMVYNFSLAPLILHSFRKGDARILNRWAGTLAVPFRSTTFFNFIASHDGIGVTPARGLLSDSDIEGLVQQTLDHGGQVSYKTNSDGSKSVYELNITLFDVLNDPHQPDPILDVRRFIASQVIMLSLAGVPGIYVHSLFGSPNCSLCFDRTGNPRSINREKFDLSKLESMLKNHTSQQSIIFNTYRRLLTIRRGNPAFDPRASQDILEIDRRLFCIRRSSPESSETVICLVNVSPEELRIAIQDKKTGMRFPETWIDWIGERTYPVTDDTLTIAVEGYQSLWLAPIP